MVAGVGGAGLEEGVLFGAGQGLGAIDRASVVPPGQLGIAWGGRSRGSTLGPMQVGGLPTLPSIRIIALLESPQRPPGAALVNKHARKRHARPDGLGSSRTARQERRGASASVQVKKSPFGPVGSIELSRQRSCG